MTTIPYVTSPHATARRLLAGILMIAGLTVLSLGADAHEYKLGGLEIVHPWARATVAKTGGAFMTIENEGQPDKLLKAASPVADLVQIHEHVMEGNVMKMREVPAINLPAGRTEMKPGGYHVMLIGLKQPLKEGTRFPLTLTFEKAGTIQVDVVVDKPGAMNSNDMGSTGGSMDKGTMDRGTMDKDSTGKTHH